MWLRSLLLFLGGAVLGTGFGVALGFFLFPFVFPPPPAMTPVMFGSYFPSRKLKSQPCSAWVTVSTQSRW